MLEQDQVAAGGEVARLVEDAVVRQEALAVHGLDLAVRADRAGVEEVAVVVRVPDECDDPARLARQTLERLLRRAHEAGAQQQILGRIARDRELGEEQEVDAEPFGFDDPLHHPLAVAVEVADDGVDLSQAESQVYASQSKT